MDPVGLNHIKTTLLLVTLMTLLLYIGNKMAGNIGLCWAFLAGAIIIPGVYWFSDRILLSLYAAKQIQDYDDPVLYGTVAYLAENQQIPMPRVFIIKQDIPNIFSMGRSVEVASIVVTTGLRDLLNKEELAGVVAHEMAHIILADTLVCTIVATLGGAVSMLANAAQWLFILGMGSRRDEGRNNFLASVLLSLCAPIMALMIQLSVSRMREFFADERGAVICGNAMWLANALRKMSQVQERYTLTVVEHNPATAHLFIMNPLRNKQWARLFATHPPIQDRIRRLEGLAMGY